MRFCNITIPACLSTFLSVLPSASSHSPQHGSLEASEPLSTSTTTLEPQFFPKYKSQRVKVTYGPYTVPSMHSNDGMLSFGGRTVPAPCTDCLVTYVHAGLEYSNGSTADASNGMWLHHTVWTNLARTGATCPEHKRNGDRFFASGNERTPVDLTANGEIKAGYEIQEGDVIAMGGELMNMRMEEREVVLSMVFEFIPTVPKDFKKVTSYWLDVGGCGNSEVEAKEDQAFQYTSPSFRTEDHGRVVFTASHLHDGGTHAEIRRRGHVVCDSEAMYGSCHDQEKDQQHIEALSACKNMGKTKPGDAWSITAYYNTSKHAPMRKMDGSLEPVMGISLVYVAVDGSSEGHAKLKIFLGLGVIALSAVLVGMWASLNGRDWLLRRKAAVVLGDDAKSSWSLLGERYRDDI